MTRASGEATVKVTMRLFTVDVEKLKKFFTENGYQRATRFLIRKAVREIEGKVALKGEDFGRLTLGDSGDVDTGSTLREGPSGAIGGGDAPDSGGASKGEGKVGRRRPRRKDAGEKGKDL